MTHMTESRDARLTEYLDGSSDDDGALPPELAALLEEDVEMATLFDDAREGRALLAGLTPAPVPGHFLRKLQRRIRRRSGGRFYRLAPDPNANFRFSIETFAIVAVVVMAACYFFLSTTGQHVVNGPIVEVPAMETSTP